MSQNLLGKSFDFIINIFEISVGMKNFMPQICVDVMNNPCPDFNFHLVKPPLKLATDQQLGSMIPTNIGIYILLVFINKRDPW